MPEEQTLESAERSVREETRTLELATLQVGEQMINLYLTGFGEIETFTQTDDNRLEQVWFFLTVRSFKSLRMAFLLLQTGYYAQSLTLSRSAAEDWLYCIDAMEHEETRRFLLDREGRPPRFQTMAERLEPHLRDGWLGEDGNNGSYALLSRFAHPNYAGMATLFEQGSGQIRVGPFFDESMFLVASNYLLLRLIRTTEFMVRLVPQDSSWLQVGKETLDTVNQVYEQNAVRAEGLLRK